MKMHTKYENVIKPFNRSHIDNISKMSRERGEKCVECGKEEVKYSQFSPDLGTLLFCSKKCYKKFDSENMYRALPLQTSNNIKENK